MKRKNKIKVNKQVVDLSSSTTNQLFIHLPSQTNTISQDSLTIRQMNRVKALRNFKYSNYQIKNNAFFSIQNNQQSNINSKKNINAHNRYSLYNGRQGSICSGYSARYAINSARNLSKINPTYKSIDHDIQNINENLYVVKKKNGQRIKTEYENDKNYEFQQKQCLNKKQLKYKSLENKSKSSNNVNKSILIFSARQQHIKKDQNKNMGSKKPKNKRRFLTQITNRKQNNVQYKQYKQKNVEKDRQNQNTCNMTIEEISSILCQINQGQQNSSYFKKPKETDLSILRNINELDILLNNNHSNKNENEDLQPDRELHIQSRFKTLPSLQTQINGQQFLGKQKEIVNKKKYMLKFGYEKNLMDKIEGKRRQKNKGLISRSIDKIKYKFPKGFFYNITNNQQI